MTYYPPASGLPDPVMLSSITDDIAVMAQMAGGTPGSQTWTANLAIFVPVRLSQPRTYVKAWWVNGAAAAGNVDVGIYTLSGTTLSRVVASTAEAQGTISTLQVAATFTTTTIGPGLYYLALSGTSSTGTFWRASLQGTQLTRAAGVFTASTSSPLPSSATAAATAVSIIPVFGFSEQAAI